MCRASSTIDRGPRVLFRETFTQPNCLQQKTILLYFNRIQIISLVESLESWLPDKHQGFIELTGSHRTSSSSSETGCSIQSHRNAHGSTLATRLFDASFPKTLLPS